MNTLTILSIGTDGENSLTKAADRVLHSAKRLVLRTERHPIVKYLNGEGICFESLDDLYESAEDFDEFNRQAARQLFALCKSGNVCYCVSDASYDTTVSALHHSKPEDISLTVLPGVSHAERCLSLIGEHAAGLRIYSASEFEKAGISPTEPLLLLEIFSRETAGDCKLKLMDLMSEELPVVFLYGSEKTGAMQKKTIPLFELDRQNHYDHLTAAYIPPEEFRNRTRRNMDDLLAIMSTLRGEAGCPWDKEQTHQSLLPHLLEEAYEYIQAVQEEDPDHMYDELGDVLFQVVFHTQIAHEHADFEFTDVTSAISQKLIERHPHVFGNVSVENSAQVSENWEAIKRKQRGQGSTYEAMLNVSKALSTLLRASKLQNKAEKAGLIVTEQQAKALLSESVKAYEENQNRAECLGNALFAIVHLCRLNHVDADIALTAVSDAFIEAFSRSGLA